MEWVSYLNAQNILITTELLAEQGAPSTVSTSAAPGTPDYHVTSNDLWTSQVALSGVDHIDAPQAIRAHLEWIAAWTDPNRPSDSPPEAPRSLETLPPEAFDDLPEILSFHDAGYLLQTSMQGTHATTEVLAADDHWRVVRNTPVWSDTYARNLAPYQHGMLATALDGTSLDDVLTASAKHHRIATLCDDTALSTWLSAASSLTPEPVDPHVVTIVSPLSNTAYDLVTQLARPDQPDAVGEWTLLHRDTHTPLWSAAPHRPLDRVSMSDVHSDLLRVLTQYQHDHLVVPPEQLGHVAEHFISGRPIPLLPDMTSSAKAELPLHDKNDWYHYGEAAPHQWILWTQNPNNPQAVHLMRFDQVPGAPPRIWPSADTLTQAMAQGNGQFRFAPHRETIIPPAVSTTFRTAMQEMKTALTERHVAQDAPSPSMPSPEGPTAEPNVDQAFVQPAYFSPMPAGFYVLWRGDPKNPEIARVAEPRTSPPEERAIMAWKDPRRLKEFAQNLNPQRVAPAPQELLVRYLATVSERRIMDQLSIEPSAPTAKSPSPTIH